MVCFVWFSRGTGVVLILSMPSTGCVAAAFYSATHSCELWSRGHVAKLVPRVGSPADGFMGIAIKARGACDSEQARRTPLSKPSLNTFRPTAAILTA